MQVRPCKRFILWDHNYFSRPPLYVQFTKRLPLCQVDNYIFLNTLCEFHEVLQIYPEYLFHVVRCFYQKSNDKRHIKKVTILLLQRHYRGLTPFIYIQVSIYTPVQIQCVSIFFQNSIDLFIRLFYILDLKTLF